MASVLLTSYRGLNLAIVVMLLQLTKNDNYSMRDVFFAESREELRIEC